MVLDVFDSNAWHFMTQVISKIGDNGYIDIIIPKFGKFTPPNIYNYYDEIDGYFNLVVVESGRAKTTYLNDFFSDGIQNFLNYWGFFDISKNIKNIRFAQEQFYDALFIFNACANFRLSLSWWLIFNPYQQPFDTLRTFVDWYLNFLTGGIPVIIGVDYGPSISLSALGVFLDYIRNLAIIVPYRYSDGKFFAADDVGSITDNPALVRRLENMESDVRIFRKLPSLWIEKPIPDNLREYWAIKKPIIFDFLTKNYYDLGVQFLPDKIAKLKAVSKSITLHDYFENISTNLICLKTEILSLNILHFHF
jgi:hypothetical protein